MGRKQTIQTPLQQQLACSNKETHSEAGRLTVITHAAAVTIMGNNAVIHVHAWISIKMFFLLGINKEHTFLLDIFT